jgi:hypothetical protein
MSRLEELSAQVSAGLEQLDWQLIRTLVKRVEIDREPINVVFRVDESTFPSANDSGMQDCWRGEFPVAGEPVSAPAGPDRGAP